MKARILVIEDSPANLDLMTYLLHAYGYTCVMANNGKEGVSKARQENPDLVICDVHLPDMDGLGVVACLKREATLRTVPVIAVTALAMSGDRERLLEAGFDGYISKPIQPEDFVAAIERFLPAHRPPSDG